MSKFVKFGALLGGAAAATTALLALTCGLLGIDLAAVPQKFAANDALYLFGAIILVEFYFLANDALAYLSRENPRRFGLEFSELPFNDDNDNNTPIPLRSKLFGLYPLMIAIVWLALAASLAK